MVNSNNSTPPGMLTAVRDFIKLESAGGILLLAAAIIALIVANSPLAARYDSLLGKTVAIQVGALSINKPFFLWINDGLMAIFFLLIGLEIKREVMKGELSSVVAYTLLHINLPQSTTGD